MALDSRRERPRRHGEDHTRKGPDPARLAIDSTATASLTRFDQGVHSLGASLGQALLADGSDGSAWGDIPQIGPAQSYSPTITGSVSDPTTVSVGGLYWEFGTDHGCLVYVRVSAHFLPPLSAGSGDWQISVPVAGVGSSFFFGGSAYFLTDPTSPPFQHFTGLHVADMQGTYVTFAYADAYPVGTYVVLGSSSLAGTPWTLANVDQFFCEFFYIRD